MGKPFISQNIGKETSPYSIQLYNSEGSYWEDAYPFKNVVRYNTSAAGHQPGESMRFRIWPVVDPNYLELRYTGGNEGTFSWESTKDGSQLLMMVQYFIALEALMLPIIVILISILPCLVL